MALSLMPIKRTERPGDCSPGRPGWNNPTTPWRLSPVRNRMILVFPFSIGTLSEGINGMPRQVRNGDPNKETVGGGTPLLVHSLPNAAIANGFNKKNPGSFHTLAIRSSKSSGVGAPLLVFIICEGATLFNKPWAVFVQIHIMSSPPGLKIFASIVPATLPATDHTTLPEPQLLPIPTLTGPTHRV